MTVMMMMMMMMMMTTTTMTMTIMMTTTMILMMTMMLIMMVVVVMMVLCWSMLTMMMMMLVMIIHIPTKATYSIDNALAFFCWIRFVRGRCVDPCDHKQKSTERLEMSRPLSDEKCFDSPNSQT